MSSRDVIKELLELSETSSQADSILEQHVGLRDTAQKIAYLRGMYDIELVSRRDDENATEEDKLKSDYLAYLATIIDLKWR
jgi:hypothetical protein